MPALPSAGSGFLPQAGREGAGLPKTPPLYRDPTWELPGLPRLRTGGLPPASGRKNALTGISGDIPNFRNGHP